MNTKGETKRLTWHNNYKKQQENETQGNTEQE